MANSLRWNIPNLISLVRILLVPLFLYLLFRQQYTASLVVCVLAGISDVTDGYLARRLQQETKMGVILDPIADKLLVVGSVLVLTHMNLLPLWLAGVIVIRDILILAGAGYLYLSTDSPSICPCFAGKLNTFVQFALIFIVLLSQKGAVQQGGVVTGCSIVAAITTIISGAAYLVRWLRQVRREKWHHMNGKTSDVPEYG